ncbi:MAG: TIGR02587 family membrane protein [Cyanobacteriota bacterium]
MPKRTRKKRLRSNYWLHEFDDIVRGVSGGFLFGIPLLYTMEVWWIGSQISPPMMLAILATTFVVVFLLNRTEGFRKAQSQQFLDNLMDSVQLLAIGIVCVAVVLILLGEIQLGTPLNEALGKIILESIPFALGAALSRSFLSGDRWSCSEVDDSDNQGDRAKKVNKQNLQATLADIGATLIGAMIIAFNIAPTDEIPMLNGSISPPLLLAIIAASLVISYGIVFQAGFTTQQKRRQQQGIFQRPLSETVASYLVSLFAAMFMLLFFNRLTFDDPWTLWLNYTILLGFPACVGGAAGRIAL